MTTDIAETRDEGSCRLYFGMKMFVHIHLMHSAMGRLGVHKSFIVDVTTHFGSSIPSPKLLWLFLPPSHCLCYMLLLRSSGPSPGESCSGFCSCGDLFSETDNDLSMQHAYPVQQEISDEIWPMHYGRTFTSWIGKSELASAASVVYVISHN